MSRTKVNSTQIHPNANAVIESAGGSEISSFSNYTVDTLETIELNVATTSRAIAVNQTDKGITVNRFIINNTANDITISLDAGEFSFVVPAGESKELSIVVFEKDNGDSVMSYIVGGVADTRIF